MIFGAKSVNLMGGAFVPIWDFAFYKNTNLFGGRDFGFQQPALFVPISSRHLFDLLSGSVPIQEHGAVFGKPVLSIALLFVEDKRSVDGRRIVLAGCAAARLGLK